MQPHDVLGVRPGAPRREVAAAFRRYAVRHHPDHGGDRERFEAGIEAYHRLTGGRVPSASAAGRADVVFHRRSRATVPGLLGLAPALLRRAHSRLSASRRP